MASKFFEAHAMKINPIVTINDSIIQEDKIEYVGFYGRVSKEEENQLRSLKNQKEIFGDLVNKNPNWELYNIYLDEGITGLNTKKRYGFKQMINDAKQGKFSICIMKSVSRFGRNMADTTEALDLLMELGIRVIFLEDNIDSSNPNDIQKFGLFSWLAEIESRKISDRVNLTFDKMRDKGYYFGSLPPYGYNKNEGKLYINPEQELIVKKIYDMYLQGYGVRKIISILNNENIKPPKSDTWNEPCIKRILTNPCYVGDTYTNQSKTVNIKSRKREMNDVSDWKYFSNTHEAIIDKESFEKVHSIMLEKRNIYMQNHRPSSKHLFSNLLICENCKSSFIRKSKHNGKDMIKPIWTCLGYDKYGKAKCTSKRIPEEHIIVAVKSFLLFLKNNKSEIYEMYMNAQKDISFDENNYKLTLKSLQAENENNHKKLIKLLDLYTNDDITKNEYLERSKPINSLIESNSKSIEIIQKKLIEQDRLEEKFNKLNDNIDYLCEVDNWTNKILKEYIDKIVICNDNTFDIILQLQKNSYDSEYLNAQQHGCWCMERGMYEKGIRLYSTTLSEHTCINGYIRITG